MLVSDVNDDQDDGPACVQTTKGDDDADDGDDDGDDDDDCDDDDDGDDDDDDDDRGKRCQKLDGQQCWPEAAVKK